MNISTLCLLGGLLVSAGACANGVIPVLELDFTRSAIETLKKHGINDACIIAAGNPGAFTYCREGSATLWKYQALDLDQQATPLKGTRLASLADGRISIAEFKSPACATEAPKPLIQPAITRGVVIGLIALFLFIGLHYTYKATMDGFFVRTVYSGTHLQRSTGSMSSSRSSRSTTKALGAFAIAAAVAFIYFGYPAL
ncbi:hypothetical protein [Pseudomonas izuensis]|uniref:hypothetical protein n=1 Tax=Pseudomonas izuensis TaxID=2684212 RepID=UPI00080C07F0|nr:hypothetical protein [Pseudomonas izuensis]BCX69055.1 hypothetical protein LAB08_R36970 [Pseudomonas izuensis]